jgi:hypothetical protein
VIEAASGVAEKTRTDLADAEFDRALRSISACRENRRGAENITL